MFYIIEVQKTQEGNYSHLVSTADTQNEAESKYYGVLQYAAISELPLHSAAMFDDHGSIYHNKAYER